MKFPDLLATRKGRLTAFFLLYITEGIPLGFAAMTMVSQMRRLGASAAEVGAFTAAIYLPWGFKWAVGPIVDVLSSDRFGRRRSWIFCMQIGPYAEASRIPTHFAARTGGFQRSSPTGGAA